MFNVSPYLAVISFIPLNHWATLFLINYYDYIRAILVVSDIAYVANVRELERTKFQGIHMSLFRALPEVPSLCIDFKVIDHA